MDQLLKFINNLNAAQRAVVIGGFSLLFVFLIGLLIYSNIKAEDKKLSYTIATGLSKSQVMTASNELEASGVPFSIIGSGDNLTLKTSKDFVNIAKIKLVTSEGVTSTHVGWEIFEKSSLGTTNFENKVKYLRALEGELSRALESLSNILRANVKIAIPKETIFTEKKNEPTASAMIALRQGVYLTQKQINGIKNFIASSIPNLKLENIQLIDQEGTLLERSQEDIESQNIETIMKMEVLELKLGIRLLQLVQGDSELLDKIKAIRKTIASELGFVIPQIRISDDQNLGINEYQLYLKRIPIAKGKVEINKLLAMGGIGNSDLKGMKVKEPVFNLDAIWIDKEQKDDALMKGYTVVDAPTIISTHISELIKKHAEDIITRQDIVDVVERIKKDFPIVVEEAMKLTSYGTLLKVCKDLLHEGIPIVDMLTIIEAVADIAEFTKAPDVLLEHVRSKLYRLITEKFKDRDGVLHLLTVKPEIEQQFIGKLQDTNGSSQLMISIAEINNLVTRTKDLIQVTEAKGFSKVAMVVDPVLRKRISEIYEKFGLSVPVLSHAELDSRANFAIEGTLEF